MADGHFGRYFGRCDIAEILMSKNSRYCSRCEKVRATVLVNRKDPKEGGKLWRIEVCPSCGFNYDLEEVPERDAKLIEGPPPPKLEEIPRWKPYYG